jgi:hypothetical protein
MKNDQNILFQKKFHIFKKKKILLFATIQFIFKTFYFFKNIKNGIFQDYFSTWPVGAAQW